MTRSKRPVVPLIVSLLLSGIPLVCLAAPTTRNTTVPSYPVADSGLNSLDQTATWTIAGHVRGEKTPMPPPPAPPGYYGVAFAKHDHTLCDSPGTTPPHQAVLALTPTSGAGTLDDGKTIGLWYDERTFINATLDQSHAGGTGNAFWIVFDVDDVPADLTWGEGEFDDMEGRQIALTDEIRYAVGAWQGDESGYQTIAVTPALF